MDLVVGLAAVALSVSVGVASSRVLLGVLLAAVFGRGGTA
jgi:hypothetical protein